MKKYKKFIKFLLYILPFGYFIFYCILIGSYAITSSSGFYDIIDFYSYSFNTILNDSMSWFNAIPISSFTGVVNWFKTNLLGNSAIMNFVVCECLWILLVNMVWLIFDFFNFIIAWGERFFNYEENKLH